MKKVYLALMCLAVVAMFTACDDKKTNEPEEQTTQDPSKPDVPDDGDDDYDWGKAYRETDPGIYMNGNELLAKGTDGSIFHIDDITSMQQPQAAMAPECIPNNFDAYDGKWSTFFFWMDYYNDNDGNLMTFTYQDTVFYKVQEEWDESTKQDINAMMFLFSAIKSYTKVAEASDFENTYIAIAKRVQVRGPIVPPSKMVPQYKKYNCEWLSEWYPKDMEDKGYVFKYTGSGKIFSMEVNRIFEWGKSVNNPKVDWLPACNVDDVSSIKIIIHGASAEDAKAFIAKIKQDGHYTRISAEFDTGEVISFAADSWDYEPGEGKVGYVYPSYSVVFTSAGYLTIEFNVAKVGFV